MMNRISFGGYSPMNMIVKTNNGNELWLGDYGAATDLQLLKKNQIKAVLTAAAMLNVSYPKQIQIKHKIIQAFDIPTYKMKPHFNEAYQFISTNIEKGNILVHCAAGISRSTTFVLIYLMKSLGHTLKQALNLVKTKRPIANPNYGFMNELTQFQLTLKKSIVKQLDEKKKVMDQSNIKTFQSEKNAVLKFLSEQKQKKELYQKFGINNKSKLTKIEQKPVVVRGKTQNGKVSVQILKEKQTKINNQLLTFKLQTPTIKK